jgi:hypothetical protein
MTTDPLISASAATLTPSPGQRMAEAFDLAEQMFEGKHWMFAKGRTRPDEPLFGFAVFAHEDDETPMAEGEAEDAVDAVMAAIGKARQ